MVTNVLVLSNNAVLGGASRSLELMIAHLVRMDIQVKVLAPSGRACSAWEAAGAEVRLWSSPTCSWFAKPLFATYSGEYSFDRILFMLTEIIFLPFRLITAQKLIRSIVSREQIEIIFVNTVALFWLSRTLEKIRIKDHVKVFWQIREVLNPRLPNYLYQRIGRKIASASSKLIAISSNEASAFNSLAPVEIIHNPVPLDWPQDPPRRVLRKPATIGMASAYRPSKGIQEYFTIAEIIHRELPDTVFLLYSPNPMTPNIRNYFRIFRTLAYRLSEKLFLSMDLLVNMTKVSYKDSIQIIYDRDLIWDNFLAMDIYIRPDRSGSPWGRDIIEAMWSGLPVVATGSNQEFIEHGKTGILVEPGRPEYLAQAILDLLRDDKQYQRMSLSSADRARSLFDKQKYHDRLILLFKE